MSPTLRVLDPSEFHLVAEAYAKAFTGPLPDNGWIVVGIVGDKIISFSVLQQVWHAEPSWVHPDFRGSSLFSRMLYMIRTILPAKANGVVVTTEDSKLARVLQSLGLEHVAVQTFRWLRSR